MSSIVSVSTLVRPERCEVSRNTESNTRDLIFDFKDGKFVYNVLNMDQVKLDDMIEEISKRGLFVHVMARFQDQVRRNGSGQ